MDQAEAPTIQAVEGTGQAEAPTTPAVQGDKATAGIDGYRPPTLVLGLSAAVRRATGAPAHDGVVRVAVCEGEQRTCIRGRNDSDAGLFSTSSTPCPS